MTTDLAEAESLAADQVCDLVTNGGEQVAVALVRTATHAVIAMAERTSQHPSGAYTTAPPVVVAFDRQAWLRIAVMCKAMSR